MQCLKVENKSVKNLTIARSNAVFKTPWFDLVEKFTGEGTAPHYSINTSDYVSVFAVTSEGGFPLVRQFRPAVEQETLELPSGHVDQGETPEQAARKELLEETGFTAKELIHVGTLSPDTGRLCNRMWCFFAPNVNRAPGAAFEAESGVEPLVYEKNLRNLLLAEPAFCSALNRAAILMAVAGGYIEL